MNGYLINRNGDEQAQTGNKRFDELFGSTDNEQRYSIDEDPYPYGDAIAVFRRNRGINKRFMLKY